MLLQTFEESLSADTPPQVPPCLLALWYDAREEWSLAHDLVNDMDGINAAAVHAYLHRKEGDVGNARYWYSRAQKKFPDISLPEEWKALVVELLKEA